MALLERARAQAGLERITLHVATVQVAARQLYASLGFEPFGCERESLKVAGVYVDEESLVLRAYPLKPLNASSISRRASAPGTTSGSLGGPP